MSHGQWYPNNFNGALAGRDSSLELFDAGSWSQQGEVTVNPSRGNRRMNNIVSSELSHHVQQENHGQSQSHSLSIISQASRETLFCSQNIAFMDLFQENMQLKAALDAQKQLVAHMMEKDKTSIVQPRSVDTSSHSRPASSKSSESFPSTAINGTVHPSSRLIIPNSPPQCSQRDYEDVQFWTRAEWTQYEHGKKEKGEKFHKLRFISQENGSMVDNARLTAIGQEATELWNTLYHTRDDPPSWKSKTKTASQYFSNSMRLKFEEFRWCEDNWKIEAFATNRYPDWCRWSRSSGQLPRALPSFNSKRKNENNVEDDVDRKKKFKSNPLLKKPKRQPLSSRDIINLNSDSDSTSESLAKPSRSKGKQRATSESIIISSLTPPPPSSPPRQQEVPLAHNSLPTSSVTDTIVQAVTTVIMPTSSSVTLSSKNVSAHHTGSPVEEAGSGSTIPQAASDNSESHSLTAPTNSASHENDPGVVDTGAGSTRLTLALARKPYSNILSNISIPKPAEDLLAPVITSAPLATAVTSVTKTTTKRGVKLMEANDSFTARNLFAIEYLKTHSPTVSEFKAIYDALDRDVIKKYEALSREKKRESTSIASRLGLSGVGT